MASKSKITGKVGGGYRSSKAAIALAEGNIELARELDPPSKKRLTDEEKCGARSQSGKPCGMRRGQGTDHPGYGPCSKHGGLTPDVNKAAMREMGRDIMARYKAEATRFGGDRNDPEIANMTPERALLEEVRRSAAMVRFLEERISKWNLSPADTYTLEQFSSSVTRNQASLALMQDGSSSLRHQVDEFLRRAIDPSSPDHPDHLPKLMNHNPDGYSAFTDAREWLYLYREERNHLARVAKMCIDAGVAQRLVSIAEDQGRILSAAIRAVLSALNLSAEQSALVPRVVPPILRAVAQDQPIPDITSLLGDASNALPAPSPRSPNPPR